MSSFCRLRLIPAILLVLSCICQPASATDRRRYKRCFENGFCRRNRVGTSSHTTSDYHIDTTTIHTTDATFTASLLHGVWPLRDALQLTLTVVNAGNAVRFQVDDTKNTVQTRFELPTGWVVHSEPQPVSGTAAVGWSTVDNGQHVGKWLAGDHTYQVYIEYQPFAMTFTVDHHVMQVINGRNLLTYEQYRKPNPQIDDNRQMDPVADHFPYDNPADDLWQETFRGHTDSKPKGPVAIGVDVTFNAQHVYGIPEHATNYSLQDTNYNNSAVQPNADSYYEPFRLFNLDVFHYELNDPMALYGAVPLMLGHSVEAGTSAFFWHNAADTYVDITTVKQRRRRESSSDDDVVGKSAHWLSESGAFDSYILLGPTAADVWHGYHTLLGFAPMPQYFSLGYQQSRWSYNDQADIMAVNAGFDQHDIPMDVIWIDIDHTANGYQYFTWNLTDYPDPVGMQKQLAAQGRYVITIQDCHIKQDDTYYVHQQANKGQYYVQQSDAALTNSSSTSSDSAYTGVCWPGAVSYLDYTLEMTRQWWADLYNYSSYKYITPTVYIWNDMNEPSQYTGPEKTIAKDALHMNRQVEHRDVHNTYGMMQMRSTYQGLLQRNAVPDRPFVLSRSWFAGSHRYGAIWTGDNTATWGHLNNAQHMLLSLSTAGFSFVGADVGGFLGEAEDQAVLASRWFQAATYQPFFRGHAALNTSRREPWLYGEPYTSYLRQAILTRYTLLPYLYTLFYLSHTQGLPVMRPLWSEFPKDHKVLDSGHVYMLGNALLVHPVVDPAASSTTVYLPRDSTTSQQLWYTCNTHDVYAAGRVITLDTPLSSIPVFQRGGTVIVRKDTPRPSSNRMLRDPFTLVVALDADGCAEGTVYVDDCKSFDYQTQRAFIHKRFTVHSRTLIASDIQPGASGGDQPFDAPIGHIQIIGAQAGRVTGVKLYVGAGMTESDLSQHFKQSGNILLISDLVGVHVSQDWKLSWSVTSHDEL